MRLNSARRIRGRAAGAVTATSPYVRDAMSVDRMMMLSVLALVPAISMALYNTGHQARSVLTAHGLGQVAGWRGTLLDLFGVTPATDGFWPDVLHGAVDVPIEVPLIDRCGGALSSSWHQRSVSRPRVSMRSVTRSATARYRAW